MERVNYYSHPQFQYQRALDEIREGHGIFFSMPNMMGGVDLVWSPDNDTPILVPLISLGQGQINFIDAIQAKVFEEVKGICRQFPSVERRALVKDCLKVVPA